MKKLLTLILSVCFCTAVFAQGVHLYKNGARITVNSNEVDSLVYFPGQEEGQSLFQYIDQAVKNAVEANQTVWEIGYDGYWYKNGIRTEYRAVGQDGRDGADGRDGVPGVDGRDGHTPSISFMLDDSGHLFVTIDGVYVDLGLVRGQDGMNGHNGANGMDGANGKDGADGKDGRTPSISFVIDANGHLIVTIDGVTTDLGRVTGDNQQSGDQDPIDPETLASFNYDFKSMHVGDTFVQEVSTISDGTVKYTSSNPSVATVDVNSGLVTALSLGETLITATVEATAKYPAGTASYKVVVEEGNFVNGYEYVDLGVKNAQGKTIYWAKCNIGAEKPADYGNYYAWGETETKSDYSWKTYKYAEFVPGTPAEYDADGLLIKPATEDHYEGQYIGDDICGTQYDAARQNWGGSWRLPTKDEILRLINQCDWTWTEMQNSDGNPIKGYKVSNKTDNSKYIFLPTAGYRSGTTLYLEGGMGGCNLWSGTPDLDYTNNAYGLHFNLIGEISPHCWGSIRCFGRSVRPVTE